MKLLSAAPAARSKGSRFKPTARSASPAPVPAAAAAPKAEEDPMDVDV
jgi:hypothetical protein